MHPVLYSNKSHITEWHGKGYPALFRSHSCKWLEVKEGYLEVGEQRLHDLSFEVYCS